MRNIKIKLIALSLIILVGLVIVGVVRAKEGFNKEKVKFVQDEIIVKFKGDVKPFRLVKIPAGKVKEKIKEYLKRADVMYAEPNYIVNIQTTPNDPNFSELWGLHNTGQAGGTVDADIDAPESWDVQTGSNNVVIAVIDTGVDYNHPDLAANIWINPGEIAGDGIDNDGNGFIDDVRGWDFYNNDNDPFDDNSHGTHCAGIIGAVGSNGIGVAGVNWNAKIMPLKFLNSDGSGTTLDAVNAVNYAAANGAYVMSNSWGGGEYSQTLKDAITAANAAGILFVAAAGNAGSDNDAAVFYPASYDVPNVVAVAATDRNDQKASWSNYGATSVDLGAPGADIYSTVPGNSYAYKSGTSMATPYVSGVAGLIKAQYPALASDGIKARLLGGADSIPALAGITVTGGRLNAYNSLEEDNASPSAVTDLTANNSTVNSVVLTWTATGDDGNVGTAKFYDVRYSTSSISEANWDAAVQAAGEPKPQPSGTEEIIAVTGLEHGTVYYFGLKVIDNVGNFSGLSNVVFETTKTPAIVFQDNMENGINGWAHGGSGDNWQLGTPTSGPGYAYSGSNVWATNLSGNYGINYMNAWLVSPSIDLSGVRESQLEFQHYYYTETNYDGGIVEASSDNGNSWTQIVPVGEYPLILASGFGNPLGSVPAYSGYSGNGWHKAVFDISAYDGNNNLKIRYRFGTDLSVNGYPGWYIDDVAAYGEPVSPPPPNNPPIADDQSVVTDEDTALGITLTAADLDGDPLTYSIVTEPSNGILTGATSSVVYIPNVNYNGEDSFTFKANDGKADSNIATVSITINSVNDAPMAYGQSVETYVATPVSIVLTASDADNDSLIYEIVNGPINGILDDSAIPNVVYTPTTNYSDSFTFRVYDGKDYSNIAVVAVTVKLKPATKCWSGTNQYLYLAAAQLRKFCKCAQGTYGYRYYKYNRSKRTVWKYVDSANNENWEAAPVSSRQPVYSVICADGRPYPINQDYYSK